MIRNLIIIFALILVFLIARLWIGNGSFPQIWDMKKQIETLSSSNKRNQEENRKLEAEIQEFQNGTEAIEARARSDFGMIKKGETFYQVILNQEHTTQETSPTTQAESDSE